MDTRSRILTSILVALAFGVVSSVAAPGWAQGSDPGDVGPPQPQVTPEEAPEVVPPLIPRECKARYMAGPGTGVVLGAGAIGFGAPLIWLGAGYGDRQNSGERGLIAGGSLMIASGLAALIYSSIKLKRNRETRRRVC